MNRGGLILVFSLQKQKYSQQGHLCPKQTLAETDVRISFFPSPFQVGGHVQGIHIYLDMSSMEQIKSAIYVNYPRMWTWTLHWECL